MSALKCQCGGDLEQTFCQAPGCSGLTCAACPKGCDIELDSASKCMEALDAEPTEDYVQRTNKARAVVGLPPVTAQQIEEVSR